MAALLKATVQQRQEHPRRRTSKDQSDKQMQYAVVRIILTYCFAAGLLLTFLIAFKKVAVEDIRGLWSIFSPFITLALGYYFGVKVKLS